MNSTHFISFSSITYLNTNFIFFINYIHFVVMLTNDISSFAMIKNVLNLYMSKITWEKLKIPVQ